ncbi:MAG: 3-phosphoshikimate 1-carboxyvinyltransferase [Cyanobacteria bacterium P01_A01_bin.68]
MNGDLKVPGDKSISHRALILSAIAIGTTKITNLLFSEDVINTLNALKLMDVEIQIDDSNIVSVNGVGFCGLSAPKNIVDMGNSGTGVRLLMGLVASYNFYSFFTGDDSLRARPMLRVIEPLMKMGTNFVTNDNKLPIALLGNDNLLPIEYTLPVASAQVKSVILLAALNIAGDTTIIEPIATRDHTERMIDYFGGKINITQNNKNNAKHITVTGRQQLTAKDIFVAGDPSSAAFFTIAALLIKGSNIKILDICISPERIGIYQILLKMGANIKFINQRTQSGENVADIEVSYSNLQAIDIEAEFASNMIDEYPIFAIAAAFANGTTRMYGLNELKVKESNRLQSIYDGLIANKINAEIGDDYLVIHGSDINDNNIGGGEVKTNSDHRIAMSFLILGMVANQPVTIDDGGYIKTSFPNFIELANSLGANIAQL